MAVISYKELTKAAENLAREHGIASPIDFAAQLAKRLAIEPESPYTTFHYASDAGHLKNLDVTIWIDKVGRIYHFAEESKGTRTNSQVNVCREEIYLSLHKACLTLLENPGHVFHWREISSITGTTHFGSIVNQVAGILGRLNSYQRVAMGKETSFVIRAKSVKIIREE